MLISYSLNAIKKLEKFDDNEEGISQLQILQLKQCSKQITIFR